VYFVGVRRTRASRARVWNAVKPLFIKDTENKVFDGDGHILDRGARMAVCGKTFQLYNKESYSKDIIAVEPIENIELETAKEFDCRRTSRRSPRETKGLKYNLTDLSGEMCGEGGDCC
jgi:arsenite methyltransferase